MNIIIDTSKITDSNNFGELLRDNFFVKGKGYGCYGTFELIDEFAKCDSSINLHTYCDKYLPELNKEERKRVSLFFNKFQPYCFVLWYWDGDGSLWISDGERVAFNGDCKRDYGWIWVA